MTTAATLPAPEAEGLRQRRSRLPDNLADFVLSLCREIILDPPSDPKQRHGFARELASAIRRDYLMPKKLQEELIWHAVFELIVDELYREEEA